MPRIHGPSWGAARLAELLNGAVVAILAGFVGFVLVATAMEGGVVFPEDAGMRPVDGDGLDGEQDRDDGDERRREGDREGDGDRRGRGGHEDDRDEDDEED